ncbi:MAG TPA: transcription termination factor NusA [Thermoanaerobaculia bacterium]|jgi:N utilization substance protein A|nr:transcription termination factor NusA [Thermoanaerobaculia bacterium]
MIIDPSVIRQVSREKDIDPEKMFGALEEAMSSAARKYYHDRAVVTAIDRKTGEMTVYAPRTVVAELDTESEEPPPQILMDEATELVAKHGTKAEVRILRPAPAEGEPPTEVSDIQLGDQIRLYREPIGLGRIAAQTAKQVLYQKVREAERDNIYNEFQPKVGELMSGTVKRFERGDMVVDLGKTEAVVPRDQQSRAERYGQGERIRAILYDVHRNPKGPQLVLSRTDPRLLIRLFEMEVPEIYDGTVVIKGAVRQPGERAKVAVRSRERDVDPVGACVGMRGSRVQSIMRELHGEKIDVILYSDDLITFAQNALAPAKITRVSPIHHEDGTMSLDCVVEDDQLSLAIGKKGQNVRLASALIGMKIEIKGETEVKGEVAEALSRMLQASRRRQTPVAEIPGVGEKTAERLAEAGLATLGDLLDKSAEQLAEIPGLGEKTAEKILEAARALEQMPSEEESSEEEGGEGADTGSDDAVVSETPEETTVTD